MGLDIFLCLLCFCVLMYAIAEPGYCPVKLGMTAGRLQSGVNTLQGFKEDKRNKVTPGKCCFFKKIRILLLV